MSRSKKILVILLVIFVVMGGGALWIYKFSSEVQGELNAAIEPMIREMSAARWSREVIDKYASPELEKWLVDNKMDNGMPGLSVLGNIREYKGVQSFDASSNAAELVAEVKFDSGDAYISLQISKRGGKWLMNSFNIDSSVLLQKVTEN